jgi:hypothetical protein
VIFALFFRGVETSIAEGLSFAFDHFLEMVPSDALRWASIGATSEEWKPFGKTTVSRCKDQLKPTAMQSRALTAFEVRGGDDGGDAPDFGFSVFVNSNSIDKPDKQNLLQMYFPPSIVEDQEVESFVSSIETIAVKIPFSSGYCSPALQIAESMASEGLDAARKLTSRYPGFDVQYNQIGRAQIGNKIRGARWINFLGPELTAELGGIAKLRKSLRDPIKVRQLSNGTMIQVSRIPEIGDNNRQLGVPSLSLVAKALEPVTQFGERVLLNYEFANGDAKKLSRWERRFFD